MLTVYIIAWLGGQYGELEGGSIDPTEGRDNTKPKSRIFLNIARLKECNNLFYYMTISVWAIWLVNSRAIFSHIAWVLLHGHTVIKDTKLKNGVPCNSFSVLMDSWSYKPSESHVRDSSFVAQTWVWKKWLVTIVVTVQLGYCQRASPHARSSTNVAIVATGGL